STAAQTTVKPAYTPTPVSCTKKECSALVEKMPTAKVPQMPHTRWTEVAPTGSSILILSNMMTEATTNMPAAKPMMTELMGVTTSAPAVMPTRPASTPFNVIERSGLVEMKE